MNKLNTNSKKRDIHIQMKSFSCNVISSLLSIVSSFSLKTTFIFILMFFALFYSQTQQSEILTLRNIPWELTVLAALFLSLSLVTLGYILSKVFNLKELNAWATNELYQIVMMSFIVFLIFGILRIENVVFSAYFNSYDFSAGQNPAITNARNYLFSVRSYLSFVMGGLLTERAFLASSNKFIENLVSPLEPITGIDPGDVADALIAPFPPLIDSALFPFAFIYGVNSMQIYFLDFIERVAFNFLLPVGLFFRIFSFTRRFGNILIVLAIAFYIVFPLTYLLNQRMVDEVLNFGQQSKIYSWNDILHARIGYFYVNDKCDFGTILTGNSNIYGCIQDTLGPNPSISNLLAPIRPVLKFVFSIFSEAAFAFILFTLIPIIDFTITIVIARELGALFGSDVSVTDIIKYL